MFLKTIKTDSKRHLIYIHIGKEIFFLLLLSHGFAINVQASIYDQRLSSTALGSREVAERGPERRRRQAEEGKQKIFGNNVKSSKKEVHRKCCCSIVVAVLYTGERETLGERKT
jgi:hypothetical protein